VKATVLAVHDKKANASAVEAQNAHSLSEILPLAADLANDNGIARALRKIMAAHFELRCAGISYVQLLNLKHLGPHVSGNDAWFRWAHPELPKLKQTKVFCFFFSKKKAFLS
jgi:hypothetical protein